MRLSEERANANKILRVYEAGYPPVDIVRIAVSMGIEIAPESSQAVAGSLDADPVTMRAVIRVRRDQAEVRQRFTVAHEIGHLMLGHFKAGKTCYRAMEATPEEAAANRYAADLLMPLWMLEPLLLNHGADAGFLGKTFQVSEEAMRFRLDAFLDPRR